MVDGDHSGKRRKTASRRESMTETVRRPEPGGKDVIIVTDAIRIPGNPLDEARRRASMPDPQVEQFVRSASHERFRDEAEATPVERNKKRASGEQPREELPRALDAEGDGRARPSPGREKRSSVEELSSPFDSSPPEQRGGAALGPVATRRGGPRKLETSGMGGQGLRPPERPPLSLAEDLAVSAVAPPRLRGSSAPGAAKSPAPASPPPARGRAIVEARREPGRPDPRAEAVEASPSTHEVPPAVGRAEPSPPDEERARASGPAPAAPPEVVRQVPPAATEPVPEPAAGAPGRGKLLVGGAIGAAAAAAIVLFAIGGSEREGLTSAPPPAPRVEPAPGAPEPAGEPEPEPEAPAPPVVEEPRRPAEPAMAVSPQPDVPEAERAFRAQQLRIRARQAYMQRDFRRSGQLFRESLELDETGDGAEGLARALARQRDLPEALSWARRAVEVEPDDPRNYEILGDLLASGGEDEEALAQYRRGVEVAPGDRDLWNRINALRRAGR